MKKIMAFALCLTLLLSAFAGGAVAEEEPVVIENMGRTTTYEEAPETAVALSYSIAEIMVALGLEDKIVAIIEAMHEYDFRVCARHLLPAYGNEQAGSVGKDVAASGRLNHMAFHRTAAGKGARCDLRIEYKGAHGRFR